MTDVKELFDSLATREQPPTSIDVDRAMAEGRAVRRRCRAALAATTAVTAAAAVLATLTITPDRPTPRPDVAVAVPSPSATPTYRGFAELKKKYPPKGRIASVPPLLMWVSHSPRPDHLFLCSSGPTGSSCSSFPPFTAEEYARRQGKLRVVNVWFGIAKSAVHGVTAHAKDGRKFPGSLTREVSPGLGLWAVEYPRDVAMRSLVFTDAKGKVLQRIPL
ncbi:hypothetical protein [Nonomuraea sp. NPDC050310]|uniref:hypothetical protein n=1 Tax=Nonomuraea sp. NPDC050310 TaxID=3154935 RepID=UPI0033D7C872